MRQKTYENYQHCGTFRYTLTQAFVGDNIIQACFWGMTTFNALVGADEHLARLAAEHEYAKLLWTKIEIRPSFNIVGPSTAINLGDMALLPVMKDSAYKFADYATAGVPLFQPSTMDLLCDGISGSYRPRLTALDSSWNGKTQPGISIGYQLQSTNWALETAGSWGVPTKSDWFPTYLTSTPVTSAQNLTQQRVWTPMVVLANWNSGVSTPMIFELRFTYSFAFKERRLNTDTAGGRAGLASSLPLRVSGATQVDHGGKELEQVQEDYEDERWEEDEKKGQGPNDAPPPKVAKTVSNSGLVRQLTNIGLGDQPPLLRGSGAKRVTAAVPMT